MLHEVWGVGERSPLRYVRFIFLKIFLLTESELMKDDGFELPCAAETYWNTLRSGVELLFLSIKMIDAFNLCKKK